MAMKASLGAGNCWGLSHARAHRLRARLVFQAIDKLSPALAQCNWIIWIWHLHRTISDFAITVWHLNNVFRNYQHIITSCSFEWGLHTDKWSSMITPFAKTWNKTTNKRMLQPSILEGVSNGALSPWVERDISPGWKETNWACPEHNHFTARQACGYMRGWRCVFSNIFTVLCE